MPCSRRGQCSDEITSMGLMQVLRQEQVQTDTPGGRGWPSLRCLQAVFKIGNPEEARSSVLSVKWWDNQGNFRRGMCTLGASTHERRLP